MLCHERSICGFITNVLARFDCSCYNQPVRRLTSYALSDVRRVAISANVLFVGKVTPIGMATPWASESVGGTSPIYSTGQIAYSVPQSPQLCSYPVYIDRVASTESGRLILSARPL